MAATEKTANKGAVSGYAGLDASQELLLVNFPSGAALQVLRRNAANDALEFAASAAAGITSINGDTTAAQIIAGTTNRISESPAFTVTIPSGWTEINNNQEEGGGSAIRATTFYRIVQAGDPSTLSVNFADEVTISAISNTYSGIDTTTPIDVEESTYLHTTGTDPVSRTVTTTTSNTMVVRTFHQDDDLESSQIVPSGLTERGYGEHSGDGSNGGIVSWGELEQASIGDTGTAQWQTNDPDDNMVQTFAIRANYIGVGNEPDWQAGSGPHGSGSYYYDASNSECHRSSQDVSSANTNDIGGNDATTSLWFRTDGLVPASTEQMLVFSEGLGSYPNSSYYKISLVEQGKVLYEFDANSGSATTTCKSTLSTYDDGNWYNAIGVRYAFSLRSITSPWRTIF